MRIVVRALLLLFIVFLLLTMASCPGLWDTKRRAVAHRHYIDSPSQATEKELEDAKRLDRRDIIIFECVMGCIVGLAFYALIRVGRKAET
jgi:hypothetical protein